MHKLEWYNPDSQLRQPAVAICSCAYSCLVALVYQDCGASANPLHFSQTSPIRLCETMWDYGGSAV